jgi:hypothetical protein
MGNDARRKANQERGRRAQQNAPATNEGPGTRNKQEAQKAQSEENLKKAAAPMTIGPSAGTTYSGTGLLKYPFRIPITEQSDYVSFNFYDYKPPFQTDASDSGANARALPTYRSYSASSEEANLTPASGFKPVILYMPEDVNAQYGANWGGAGFGIGYREIAKTVANGGVADFDTLLDSILLGGLKIAGYKTAVENINKALGGNVSVNQLMGGVSGTIVNPNVEMMYEAPELRGFNLSFKMMSRSKEETAEIKQICTQFKKAMLPSFGGTTFANAAESGALLSVPKIVKVSFMTGNGLNEYVSQFKPCAITSVNINYTPDGAWATYKGGAPVATELQITFKELKLIFANEITDTGATY